MVETGIEQELQEAAIEKACEEYNKSVRTILTLINQQLDQTLIKNCEDLDELGEKIAARASFLEKNPTFLSSLHYKTKNVRVEPFKELDEIKITLKEYSRRINEKIQDIEKYHKNLFELVALNSQDQKNLRPEETKTTYKEETKTTYEEETTTIPEKKVEEIKPTKPEDTTTTTATTLNTKYSFDKVIIQKNAYSDSTLDRRLLEDGPVKLQLFPDLPPEVQRGKPLEDLHGKLIQQLQATDSLESFVKLMERKPSSKRKIKPKKSDMIEEKYTGSLYFFPQKGIKRRISRNTITSPTPSQKSTKIMKLSKTKQQPSSNLLVTSVSIPCDNQERTRRIRESLGRNKLKYYDLLDDLEGKDLKPIQSEYPRRDNLYEKQMKLRDAKTYLHRMMEENEKVWKKLLQPKPEPKKIRNKHVNNLMEYLTAPEQKFLHHRPQTLIVMPVKVVYDNFPTKELSAVEQNDDTTPKPVLITDLSQALAPSPPKKPEPPKKPLNSPLRPPPLFNVKSNTPRKEEKRPIVPLLQTQPRTDLTRSTETSPNSNIPAQRKKEILEQLKGLKMRNDSIQKNIQKAIDVIETKMIDLLSSPKNTTSAEAFNAMEQEISNVLKMMNETESEKKKKIEKVEAEKDENHTKSIKTPPKKKKVSIASSNHEEARRTANIEEGERLLGQVDNVIKKIDNIYTRFNDGNKQKKPSKKDDSFNNVLDFFDGLKNILETPPVEISFWSYEDSSGSFQEATSYFVPIIYNEVRLEYPPTRTLSRGDFIETWATPATEEETTGSNEERAIVDYEEMEKIREERHESVLQRFYAFFFSTIFVVLNFDYAS